MKNLFRFLMAVIVLFTASCAKEDISSSIAGEETIEVFFATNLADLGTRAYDEGKNVTTLRYFVCDKAGNILNDLSDTIVKAEEDKDGKFSFSLNLIKSMEYNIYFWAHSGVYAISNEGVVSIDYANNAVAANDGNLDAFYGSVNITPEKQGTTQNISLTRPFAQLNVLTSDGEEIRKNDVASYANITSSATVKGVYSQFNLLEGAVTGEEQTVTFAPAMIPAGYNDVVTLKENHTYLSMNYLFVPTSCVADVQFTFTATRTNNAIIEVKTPEYTSVPLKPNYRTNILGALLTNPTAFNVEVVKDYDGTKEHKVVSVATATELFDALEAINNASAEEGKPTEVVLERNIDFDNLTSRADVGSFLTIEKDKEMILNLNGCTISGTDNGTASFGLIVNKGKLTINDSKGNGKIQLTATQNRGWSAYSSVISNSTGVLVVNSGTLEHLGGTDMAYGIDNLSGSLAAEATINGGTVKSTYRAIRQFTNSTTAENILTVNGGVIEGANKSIWMQDPNKNANKGTLTVAANAQLKGDVYLFVTAGSTEWPVSVSIAEAALQGESTVVTGNVPDLYEVEVVKGAWTVKAASYKDYVMTKNFFYGDYISVSTGEYFLPIVAVMPEITKFSVFDGDTRITDKVVFRFFKVKKENIDENSYKVSFVLAIKDDKGNDLELKPGMPSTINGKEYLHVYVNLIELPTGYDVTEVKVNGTALTTNTSGNPATGEYWFGENHKDVHLQTKTAGKMEFIVSKTAN